MNKNCKVKSEFVAVRDNEQLESIKAAYLKHCFKTAKEDLAQGKVVEGATFLSAL
ncbi:hypothetical protein [Arsukibacterium ikkense]|uniref:hypothetical protein n=1 Tax=Arsukibacterium ikkense TaxID=336831 RepID=UPI0013792B70|nr:hypothetical protein [Arsukibacterium ikkense]